MIVNAKNIYRYAVQNNHKGPRMHNFNGPV